MIEIERKYLVRINQQTLPIPGEVVEVKQGYLVAAKTWEWRVRKVIHIGPITGEYKGSDSTTAIKIGNGFIRKEYECYIPNWLFSCLSVCVPHKTWLYKTRLCLDKWVVDIFNGTMKGLVLSEIELDSEVEELPPIPTGLQIIADVTGNPAFSNKTLSRMVEPLFVNIPYPVSELTCETPKYEAS